MTIKTLGDVARYINGRPFKPAEWEDTGKPIIRIQNLTDTSQVCNRTTKTYEEKYLVRDGDLLFAWSASLGAHIWHGEDGWLNQHIYKVLPNEGTNKAYLYYYLLHIADQLKAKTHGSGMVHITTKPFKETPVYLPSINEQQRIVDRIESLFAKLDEAKEKAQAVVDGFETRKAAILHKAFTGDLTAKWRQENNLASGTWGKALFDDCVLKMQNGLAKRSGTNGVPLVVLRLANLSDDGFITDDLREIVLDEKEQLNYELKQNDVIMIRVNGSKDNVGKQFLITNQKNWAFCDHIIRIVYKENVHPEFMIYFSKSEQYRLYIKENMVSSAGQNTISRKGMSKLVVPLPTLAEQKEIVRTLDNLIGKEQQAKEAAEAVLDRIETMKKAILARAFRGELGTNDPTEESAVELLKQVLKT